MKFWLISFVSVVLTFPYSYSTKAASDAFLKPGSYSRSVVIPTPEKSLLAEGFLRTGVDVYKACPINTSCFSFTIDQTLDFTVFIYYPNQGTFVGRYVFVKNPADERPVDVQFVLDFVPWMQNNAWSK
jgi:hypothetical protein